jgi:hypothetical protein
MITDLFKNRYERVPDFQICKDPNFDQSKLFVQLFKVFEKDLLRSLGGIEGTHNIIFSYGEAEERFCRELGIELPSHCDEGPMSQQVPNAHSSEGRIKHFLLCPEFLWRENLSLFEILMREYEVLHKDEISFLEEQRKSNESTHKRIFPDPYQNKYPSLCDKINYKKKAYEDGVNEINIRLSEIGLKLKYYNGYFWRSDDNLYAHTVEKPFWDLVKSNPKYTSIESDMQEALDYLAKGKYGKAAQHAFMAFEGALKIILGIQKNIPFGTIVYEELKKNPIISALLPPSDYLAELNKVFRNEAVHNPGEGERIIPTRIAAEFAIQLCMICITLVIKNDPKE